jgi:hypothetical protein
VELKGPQGILFQCPTLRRHHDARHRRGQPAASVPGGRRDLDAGSNAIDAAIAANACSVSSNRT